MAALELQKVATQQVHDEEKRHLESVHYTDLQTLCAKMEVKYEKKRQELLVAEAKLMQEEGSTNTQIAELRKKLAAA